MNLLSSLRRSLFAFAKSEPAGALVRLAFGQLSFAIPVQRLVSHTSVLCFLHPKPAWQHHVLIVPKCALKDLVALANPATVGLFSDVLCAAREVILELGIEHESYFLCANGGSRQEVQQVHFHIGSGLDYVGCGDGTDIHAIESVGIDPAYVVGRHPSPKWPVHLVVRPQAGVAAGVHLLTDAQSRTVSGLIGCIPALDRRFGMRTLGYTVVIQPSLARQHHGLEMHVVAGAR